MLEVKFHRLSFLSFLHSHPEKCLQNGFRETINRLRKNFAIDTKSNIYQLKKKLSKELIT